ncbi:MAG: hypothetical protein HC888_02325 [Candidatus Competibacteraceae bacterium]|nr:hypothetical protein [Candidatus Competibacteraceae bacterium]
MSRDVKFWTPKEDDKLISLREDGLPYSHIGAVMNRTIEAIKQRVKFLRQRDPNYVRDESKVAWQGESVRDYSRPWTGEDMQVLYEARRQRVPYREIARELKRSEKSCASKYNTTNWHATKYHESRHDGEDRIYQAQKAAVNEKIVQAHERKVRSIRMGADIIADAIRESVKAYPPVPPPVAPKWTSKLDDQAEHIEDMVAMLSDVHVGAEHSLHETGGISECNQDIIAKRMDNYKYAVRDIYELHSKLYRIPTLHVACLGDIVAGMNEVGNWSPTYINQTVVDQTIKGYTMIGEMLRYWLTIFENITFYGVRGNHGRCSQKRAEKDYVNWDYMMYLHLQAMFANEKRIKFVCPPTWWILAEIQGCNVLMVHGDDLKGGSFPVKSLVDFENKMAGILQKPIHITLAGHYHCSASQSTNHGKVLINGSVIGGDVYSIKEVHSYTKPEQTLFGIKPNRMTFHYDIDLESPRTP